MHTAVVISAVLPNLDALDVEAFKARVLAQHSELLEQHQSNTQQIEHLKLVIEKYRRMVFGAGTIREEPGEETTPDDLKRS